MPIKVEKKDGSLEDFDRNKVSGGLTVAGVASEDAEAITGQVEVWIQGAAVEGVVKSSEIRIKVLELLKPINPEIAAKFESYQK